MKIAKELKGMEYNELDLHRIIFGENSQEFSRCKHSAVSSLKIRFSKNKNTKATVFVPTKNKTYILSLQPDANDDKRFYVVKDVFVEDGAPRKTSPNINFSSVDPRRKAV